VTTTKETHIRSDTAVDWLGVVSPHPAADPGRRHAVSVVRQEPGSQSVATAAFPVYLGCCYCPVKFINKDFLPARRIISTGIKGFMQPQRFDCLIMLGICTIPKLFMSYILPSCRKNFINCIPPVRSISSCHPKVTMIDGD